MEMRWLTEQTGYIDNPSAVGVCRIGASSCLLIDTGLDADAAKKILRLLEAEGLTPSHVLNTHSHADHCGGNQGIQKRVGARFLASAGEKSYIEWPGTEPHYLFGAYPPKVLRSKFLQAKPSVIHETVTPGKLILEGAEFEILSLPGHSPDMVGVKTSDGVCFLADAVFDRTIVEKYGMLYHYRLEQVYETLDILESLEADHYVLSHGGHRTSLREDLAANREGLDRVNRQILEAARDGVSREALHQQLVLSIGIEETLPTYFLNDSLLGSHLGYLISRGEMEIGIEKGIAMYRTVREMGV